MNNKCNTHAHSFSWESANTMKTYEAIAKLMEDSGENPHSLSPKVRIPQPTIYRIMTGQTAEPKRANIDKLAKFFNVSSDAL